MARRALVFILLCVSVALVCNAMATDEEMMEFDRFGGLKAILFEATGFFRTQYDGARWWFVTPEGHAFLSIGANCIGSSGDADRSTGRHPYQENVKAKYGSIEQWRETAAERLRQWGMNTLGGWSTGELRDQFPYTLVLHFAPGGWASRGPIRTPDFFSASFKEHAENQAAGLSSYVDDPMLIGYFLDNELPWVTDYRLNPSLFDGYAAMPADAPGKQRLVEFFRERYGSVEAFKQVWKADIADWQELGGLDTLTRRDYRKGREDRHAFTHIAAKEYFRVATEAIRAVDPNHLTLGCRFVWQLAPKAVVKACAEYCDVVSLNFYETGILMKPVLALMPRPIPRMPHDRTRFASYYEVGGKPIMITEFSFRGRDSDRPSTYPPGLAIQPNVATQADRGAKYAYYVTHWAESPHFIGWHWFQYMDQPVAGRFDGENSNFGIVTIDDEPYEDFVQAFVEANQRAWALHVGGKGK